MSNTPPTTSQRTRAIATHIGKLAAANIAEYSNLLWHTDEIADAIVSAAQQYAAEIRDAATTKIPKVYDIGSPEWNLVDETRTAIAEIGGDPDTLVKYLTEALTADPTGE